jgi:hypothetical protein
MLFLLIALCVFGQQVENVFLGKWNFQYRTQEDKLIDGGTITFFEDFHCQIATPKSTTDYDYSLNKQLVFISDFGWYYEVLDKSRIKLIPAFDDDMKYLVFIRAEK